MSKLQFENIEPRSCVACGAKTRLIGQEADILTFQCAKCEVNEIISLSRNSEGSGFGNRAHVRP